MKKIFLGISMMLLSAISFTAAAQTQEAKQCAKETCKQEQCDKAKKCDKKGECDKAAKKCDKAAKKCDKASKKCDKATACCKEAKKCDKAAVCDKEAKKCCKGDSAMRCSKEGKQMGFHHGKGDGKHFGPGKGMRGGREALFEGIELNETQKAQIEALDKKMAEERKAVKDGVAERSAEAKAEAKEAAKKAREAYNLSIKEILTEEQYVKYEANMQAMKMRMAAKKDFRDMKGEFRKNNPTVEKPQSK